MTRTPPWPTSTPATGSTSSSRVAPPWPQPSSRPGLVDEIVVYVAPMLLGAGRSAVADLGITTIADAFRPRVTDITVLDGVDGEEPNVRLTLTPTRTET